jgi:hypothetical protein
MKSGNLNLLEPSGPLQACNGTALPLPYFNHLLLVKNNFLVPEKCERAISAGGFFFLSIIRWVTILKCLAFYLRAVVMHATLITCEDAVGKVIALAVAVNDYSLTDMFRVPFFLSRAQSDAAPTDTHFW